jgi:hypothetical protein
VWEGNFQELESFSFMNQNDMKWLQVETAVELTNVKMGQAPNNIDQLFDEVHWLRRFITRQDGSLEGEISTVKRSGSEYLNI